MRTLSPRESTSRPSSTGRPQSLRRSAGCLCELLKYAGGLLGPLLVFSVARLRLDHQHQIGPSHPTIGIDHQAGKADPR